MISSVAVAAQVEGVSVAVEDTEEGEEDDSSNEEGIDLAGIRELVAQINQAGNEEALTTTRYTGDVNSLGLNISVGEAKRPGQMHCLLV